MAEMSLEFRIRVIEFAMDNGVTREEAITALEVQEALEDPIKNKFVGTNDIYDTNDTTGSNNHPLGDLTGSNNNFIGNLVGIPYQSK